MILPQLSYVLFKRRLEMEIPIVVSIVIVIGAAIFWKRSKVRREKEETPKVGGSGGRSGVSGAGKGDSGRRVR